MAARGPLAFVPKIISFDTGDANQRERCPMPTVTRTLQKGGDTGKLDRGEVRAVTAAIAEGRTAEVLSGAVLKQFRAARKKGALGNYEAFGENVAVRRVATKTTTLERSARTVPDTGRTARPTWKDVPGRVDGGDTITVPSGPAAPAKGKASSRSKK
jgi:hypothetical protein